MDDQAKVFENFLKKRSLKLTRTRRLILEAVFRNHDHFDVDTLYDQIKTRHQNVSRATIYRTLPLLVQAGLLKQSLRCQDKDHYEHIYGHERHLHFLCTRCGNIIEIESGGIEKIIRVMAEEKDFKIMEYNIVMRGICANCRTGGE
ncbi:MAG: transcriptional repressor [Candidatus Cloacimonetes bacterium]|nr:transcriptional repressor [Candidatus Cloacimonadota bacterium]